MEDILANIPEEFKFGTSAEMMSVISAEVRTAFRNAVPPSGRCLLEIMKKKASRRWTIFEMLFSFENGAYVCHRTETSRYDGTPCLHALQPGLIVNVMRSPAPH